MGKGIASTNRGRWLKAEDGRTRAYRAGHGIGIWLARTDPEAFGAYCFRDTETGEPWQVAEFHRRYQRFFAENDRGVILAPAEHGKTQTLRARMLWELGRNPDLTSVWLGKTHGQAVKRVRSMREDIDSTPRVREVFPKLVAGSPWSDSAWSLGSRTSGIDDPSMEALGVRGGIMGSRVGHLAVDDPCDWENTRTAALRDDLYSWFVSSAVTRLLPRGKCHVICNAWHEDDVPHRLVAQGWPHIIDSAIDGDDIEEAVERTQEGTLRPEDYDRLSRSILWPSRWTLERLVKRRLEMTRGPFHLAFLNDVRGAGLGLFGREWFPILDKAPPGLTGLVRYWDLAGTEAEPGKDPAWTAGVKIGTVEGAYVILDVRRDRRGPKGVEDLVRRTAMEDGTGVEVWIEQEPGSSGKAVIDHYARDVLYGYSCTGEHPTGDKVTRALPAVSAAENRLVSLVRAEWNAAFLDEATSFPFGRYKDQIDALSGALAHCAQSRGRVETGTSWILAR
jgi:predicted phage terminase large subunit-like protein